MGGHWLLQPELMSTRELLKGIDDALSAYRTQTGSFPESLLQLRELRDETLLEPIPFSIGEMGPLRDEWGRPLLYATDGLKCTVLTLGRDGRPGGRGPDCDLSNQEPNSGACYPTLVQFLFALETGKMPQAWIAGGALTFLTCLVGIKARDFTRKGARAFAWNLGLTMIGATVMAVFLSALEVPSGH